MASNHSPTPNQNHQGTISQEHVGEWPNMETTEAFHSKEGPNHWTTNNNLGSNLGTVPTTNTNGASSQHLDEAKTSHNLTGLRTALGLHPLAPIDETHDEAPHQDLLWSRIRLTLREPFAEFLGVFVLVMFGDGSVAQVLLSTGQATAPGTPIPPTHLPPLKLTHIT